MRYRTKKEIAMELGISVRTLRRKLGGQMPLRKGLLSPDEVERVFAILQERDKWGQMGTKGDK